MNIQHRPPPRRLKVRHIKFTTPNMLRLTLGGAGLTEEAHKTIKREDALVAGL